MQILPLSAEEESAETRKREARPKSLTPLAAHQASSDWEIRFQSGRAKTGGRLGEVDLLR